MDVAEAVPTAVRSQPQERAAVFLEGAMLEHMLLFCMEWEPLALRLPPRPPPPTHTHTKHRA